MALVRLELSLRSRTLFVAIAAAFASHQTEKFVRAYSLFGIMICTNSCDAALPTRTWRASFATWSARKKSGTISANPILCRHQGRWCILGDEQSHKHYCEKRSVNFRLLYISSLLAVITFSSHAWAQQTFLGFDRNDYPGDANLKLLRQ